MCIRFSNTFQTKSESKTKEKKITNMTAMITSAGCYPMAQMITDSRVQEMNKVAKALERNS